jgi:hypothetical protein
VVYVTAAEGLHFESATLRTTRRQADFDTNYRAYRDRWDPILVPAEDEYLRWMTGSGIRRVVVFGTGVAGRALGRTLQRNGVAVAAFAATAPDVAELDGCPVVALQNLGGISYDRLIVGTQYFFEVEDQIRPYDPEGNPLFPVLEAGPRLAPGS